MTPYVWFLIFTFAGAPDISGPFTLEVCLDLARRNEAKTGIPALCYNRQTRERRRISGRLG